MNNIEVFNSPQFGEIRTAGTGEKPLFCLADVCKALDIKNVSDCKSRLNVKGVVITDTPTPGGVQQMSFIDEGNLYKCIFQSRKADAEKFQYWVTDEVLPSIRKNGGYVVAKQDETPEELMSRALLIAQETLKRREERIKALQDDNAAKDKTIAEQKPKALFADAVSCSDRDILVGELAKILKQNGIETGQNRLFKWLRGNGFLCNANGERMNMPTQKAMELGLFRIKKTVVNQPNGAAIVKNTPKVTPKGQIHFVNHFLGKEAGDGL